MKKVTKLPQPNDFSCDMYNAEEDYFYGKDCMEKVEYRVTCDEGCNHYFCKKHLSVYLEQQKEKIKFSQVFSCFSYSSFCSYSSFRLTRAFCTAWLSARN